MRPLDARVLPFLDPARRTLLVALAAGGLGGLLTVAQAFALGTLLVRLVEDPGDSSWHVAALWLAVIVIGRGLAGYVVDVASARAATQVSIPLRRRIVQATLTRPGARPEVGAMTLLATRGMTSIEPYLTRYLPALVLAAVLPAATLASIFWLDWLSGLIVALTLPLVPVFAILIGAATRDRARRQWRSLSALSRHFLDVVRGLPTLVTHRRATAQSATIRLMTDRYRQAARETLGIAFASSAALELIATISVALVAVSVGLRLASGSLDFLTALIVLLLAPEAYWPLRRVGAEYHSAAEGAAAFDEAAVVLATEADPTTTASASIELPPDTALTLDGLTLRYPNRRYPTIDQLDATIPGRGLTAIVGPSGCGKSTLLAGIMGELPPSAGVVRLGDQPLNEEHLESWRSLLASSPQRPWLSAGPIRDNLRIGRPDASDREIWAALDTVSLAHVVHTLPNGLESLLGEDGSGLSAGEKARLTLARIVMADRPYVFLDEPTAHLDPDTERVLLDTIRDLSRRACVVVVAHRPAVVKAADHVISLPGQAISRAILPGTPSRQPVVAVGTEIATPDGAPNGHREDQGDHPVPAVSRWGTRTGTLLGVLSVGSGVALTATASWLITSASSHPPVLTLMVAIVGVRAFGLARPALRYAERLVSHDAALRLLAERRADVFDVLVPLVPGRLGPRRGDVLTSVVDDVDSLLDRQLRMRQPIATALWVGLGAALFAGIAQPEAGVIIAGVGLLGMAAGFLAYRGAARAESDFVRGRAALSARVEEIVRSARQLVLWQSTEPALSGLDDDGQLLALAGQRSTRALAHGRSLVLAASGLGVVAMSTAVIPGSSVSPAMAALLVMLPVALLEPMSGLPEAGAMAARTFAAQQRMTELAQLRPVVTQPPVALALADARPESRADRVTAGWGTIPVLVDLSLTLRPGARLGLVGASGTGKSTYAALMMRFLDPSAGIQSLGRVDLRGLAIDDVRRVTGLVDDDPYIFGSTILENVRLARPDASDRDVREALDAARLGGWIDSLPENMETRIGEGGAQISGGERTRLAIARALLADQPILVLDEPTAYLDATTARAISEEILDRASGRSLVWITHGTIGLDAMDCVVTLPSSHAIRGLPEVESDREPSF
jgi:ATP-binding cassette, subfamily C, bacterial CydCD